MRPRNVLLVGLLGVLLAGPALPADRARALDAAERRLVAEVEAGTPASLALLQQVVDVNSGTMNREGVRAVAEILRPRFEALGFRVRWVDGSAGGRAGHLVAERAGRDARLRVLLIGHLDTVFERDSPFQRFEHLSDSTARGPGVSDMKGGDVILLLALRALEKAGALERLHVTAVLTGDEEKSGRPLELARRDLIEAARGADVAIGFEDGAGDPRTPVISRRSAGGWTLFARGTSAHSSQVFKPGVGTGAIFEAARILEAFRDSLAGVPWLTFNPGVVLGGTSVRVEPDSTRGTAFGKTNVVAESTVVAGDLRAISPGQRDSAQATMRRIVSRHLPGTDAAISFDDGYPPLPPAEGNRRLLAAYDAASRDLGYGPVTAVAPDRAGAADISFTSGLIPMAMDGIGMMGTGGHTVNETADLRTLPMNAKRVALMLLRLSQKPPRSPAP